MAERDYAFEALAEATNTDWNEGRGQLNASLASIRRQCEIEDDYLLSCEIHDRAKMYRALYSDVALTPTALAKHWLRVKEESSKKRGGANLHAPDPVPEPHPPSNRERNLEEARKLLAKLSQ
jgi:hypothetical protein